jgi:hypothetical protein
VEEMSGLPVAGGEPIIGHNVFTHETGIHTAGITIHPAIYQFLPPAEMGAVLQLPWAMAMPWLTAASVARNSPPSENESGVTFRTPMRRARFVRSMTFPPILQRVPSITLQTIIPVTLFDRRGNAVFR